VPKWPTWEVVTTVGDYRSIIDQASLDDVPRRAARPTWWAVRTTLTVTPMSDRRRDLRMSRERHFDQPVDRNIRMRSMPRTVLEKAGRWADELRGVRGLDL
jgi:hypothetical protein